MARAIWTGVITFGLVTVPVGLYTSTEDHTVHFHQLQRGTSDRIRNRRVNERTGDEVDTGDIVKGYEIDDGEYVVVEPDELDDIAPGRSRTIDISDFVDLDDIEPVYFDRTYYIAPSGKEYTKVYELLRAALAEANKAGIATFVMRNRQYLTALRAEGEVLVLQTLHWADEVRDPGQELPELPSGRAGQAAGHGAAAGRHPQRRLGPGPLPRHVSGEGARAGQGQGRRPGDRHGAGAAGGDQRGRLDEGPRGEPPGRRLRPRWPGAVG
ncbi:Ku protein [Streptomyces sp. NPDC001312]|uniref:non-homologous end joining protein Ku n=1 Tax=Streptomyces sp. NPDC001312 TaxID=3364561 RepID=UPI0036B5C08B